MPIRDDSIEITVTDYPTAGIAGDHQVISLEALRTFLPASVHDIQHAIDLPWHVPLAPGNPWGTNVHQLGVVHLNIRPPTTFSFSVTAPNGRSYDFLGIPLVLHESTFTDTNQSIPNPVYSQFLAAIGNPNLGGTSEYDPQSTYDMSTGRCQTSIRDIWDIPDNTVITATNNPPSDLFVAPAGFDWDKFITNNYGLIQYVYCDPSDGKTILFDKSGNPYTDKHPPASLYKTTSVLTGYQDWYGNVVSSLDYVDPDRQMFYTAQYSTATVPLAKVKFQFPFTYDLATSYQNPFTGDTVSAAGLSAYILANGVTDKQWLRNQMIPIYSHYAWVGSWKGWKLTVHPRHSEQGYLDTGTGFIQVPAFYLDIHKGFFSGIGGMIIIMVAGAAIAYFAAPIIMAAMGEVFGATGSAALTAGTEAAATGATQAEIGAAVVSAAQTAATETAVTTGVLTGATTSTVTQGITGNVDPMGILVGAVSGGAGAGAGALATALPDVSVDIGLPSPIDVTAALTKTAVSSGVSALGQQLVGGDVSGTNVSIAGTTALVTSLVTQTGTGIQESLISVPPTLDTGPATNLITATPLASTPVDLSLTTPVESIVSIPPIDLGPPILDPTLIVTAAPIEQPSLDTSIALTSPIPPIDIAAPPLDATPGVLATPIDNAIPPAIPDQPAPFPIADTSGLVTTEIGGAISTLPTLDTTLTVASSSVSLDTGVSTDLYSGTTVLTPVPAPAVALDTSTPSIQTAIVDASIPTPDIAAFPAAPIDLVGAPEPLPAIAEAPPVIADTTIAPLPTIPSVGSAPPLETFEAVPEDTSGGVSADISTAPSTLQSEEGAQPSILGQAAETLVKASVGPAVRYYATDLFGNSGPLVGGSSASGFKLPPLASTANPWGAPNILAPPNQAPAPAPAATDTGVLHVLMGLVSLYSLIKGG